MLALASIASELGGTRGSPAATPVLRRLLVMLDTRDVFSIVAVGEAFRRLSAMVAPDQARALLTPVLSVLEHHEGPEAIHFMTQTLRGWFDRGLLTEADAALVRAAAQSRLSRGRRELAERLRADAPTLLEES